MKRGMLTNSANWVYEAEYVLTKLAQQRKQCQEDHYDDHDDYDDGLSIVEDSEDTTTELATKKQKVGVTETK